MRACTVVIDDEAVFSRVVPILPLEGRKITTVEGLGRSSTRGPCNAFIEKQAAQCGFCIPGMMMRAHCSGWCQEAVCDGRGDAHGPAALIFADAAPHMRILAAVTRAGELMSNT